MGILKRDYQTAFNSLVICFCLVFAIFNLGFSAFQNERSSKRLVKVLDKSLPVTTLWIFEGSREIGSAGGLSYYLNQNKQGLARANQIKSSQAESNQKSLPLGFVEAKDQRVYRNVLVLEDGGNNRIPPQFPGSKPSYLINKKQLQTYWDGQRPTLFITDLLRRAQDLDDPISLNLPNNIEDSFDFGARRIYLNRAALQSIKIDSATVN